MSNPTEDQIDKVSRYTMELLKLWNPEVVILAGDTAFTRIAMQYNIQRENNNSLPQIPFVFCGIYQHTSSAFISTDSSMGTISGIQIDLPFQKQINYSLTLHPNPKKIAFLFDASESSLHQANQLDSLIQSNSLQSNGLAIEIIKIDHFSQFKQIILNLQNNSSAIIVENAMKLYSDSTNTTTVLPHNISDWVSSNVLPHVLGPISLGFHSNV